MSKSQYFIWIIASSILYTVTVTSIPVTVKFTSESDIKSQITQSSFVMGASSSLSSASIETTSAMNSSMNTSTSTINTNSNIIVNTSKGNDNNNKNDLTTITSSPSGCPVQHKNIMTTTVGSSTLNSSSNSTTEKSSECPVKYKNPSVYNVRRSFHL